MAINWKSGLSLLGASALIAACGGGTSTTSESSAPAKPAEGAAATPAASPAMAGGEAAAPAEGGAPAYEVIQVADGGKVTGKVTVTGTVPPNEEIEVTKDPQACGTKKMTETYMVKDGALGNVVVWLDGVTKGKDWVKKDNEVDQKECHYVPHVTALGAGGNLDVVNSDAALHNIHAYSEGETLFNFAQPNKDQKTPKKLTKTGPIELKCDVHSWMHAWVFVAPHPYYAVTGADGTYTIDNVPAGSYKVKAWHEAAGTKDAEAKVDAKGEAKVDIAFEAK